MLPLDSCAKGRNIPPRLAGEERAHLGRVESIQYIPPLLLASCRTPGAALVKTTPVYAISGWRD
jgi:hypothetical protein